MWCAHDHGDFSSILKSPNSTNGRSSGTTAYTTTLHTITHSHTKPTDIPQTHCNSKFQRLSILYRHTCERNLLAFSHYRTTIPTFLLILTHYYEFFISPRRNYRNKRTHTTRNQSIHNTACGHRHFLSPFLSSLFLFFVRERGKGVRDAYYNKHCTGVLHCFFLRGVFGEKENRARRACLEKTEHRLYV